MAIRGDAVITIRQPGPVMVVLSLAVMILGLGILLSTLAYLMVPAFRAHGFTALCPSLPGIACFFCAFTEWFNQRRVMIDRDAGAVHVRVRHLYYLIQYGRARFRSTYPLQLFDEVRLVRERRAPTWLLPRWLKGYDYVRLCGPGIEVDLIDPGLLYTVSDRFWQRIPPLKVAELVAKTCALPWRANTQGPEETGARG